MYYLILILKIWALLKESDEKQLNKLELESEQKYLFKNEKSRKRNL